MPFSSVQFAPLGASIFLEQYALDKRMKHQIVCYFASCLILDDH
jgi:hypothetical protein